MRRGHVTEIRGIVLAGGTGTRLLPLTRVTNKHLLPVGRRPMIFYPVGKLVEAGLKRILVVTGREHMGDVIELLGSGRDIGAEFTFRVQDEPGGIAQALGLAEDFVGGGRAVVILGDNIFAAPLTPFVESYRSQREGAKIILKRVPDPQRFGVAEFDPDGKIRRILEKPKSPPGDLAVTGIYMYDAAVFDVIRRLRPSARGELEITDVNNHYLAAGTRPWDELPGEWTDAGTFESLARAGKIVASAEEGDRS